MSIVTRKQPEIGEIIQGLEWLDLAGTGRGDAVESEPSFDCSQFTLRDLCTPQKLNDPCVFLRAVDQETRYSVNSSLHLPPSLPDNPCMSLQGFSFWSMPHGLVDSMPGTDYVDVSNSKMLGFPEEFYHLSLKTLLMAGCHKKLPLAISNYLTGGTLKSPDSIVIRKTLEVLDLSDVGLCRQVVRQVMDCFPVLEKVFLCRNNFTEFPFDLDKRRMFLRIVDLSHNEITGLPDTVWSSATRGAFSPSFPNVITGKRLLSLHEGIERGYVWQRHPGVFIGAPRDEDGNYFHLDLRGNPLNQKTHDILSRFNRVKISDHHQVVILPENCFVYADLPIPPRTSSRYIIQV